MKLPFFKKKEKPKSDVPMIKQQIIPKGVSPIVRPKEEIYKQARMRTRVPEEYMKIELSDKASPRHGYAVLKDGEKVGEVTTGYHTISSDKSVCMALVDSRYAKLDTPLDIQIRKKVFPGKVVKKRFYDKHYKK